MGHAVSSLVDSVVGVADDVLGLVGIDLVPDQPQLQAPDTSAKNVGQLPGIQGKTADGVGESDSKRKTISKKRLGTKQLQIPLSNTKDVVNTGSDIGVN